MDSRLVLTLMFLTGCFMGTYAQTTTTATSMNPPSTNATSITATSMNPPSTNATSIKPPGSNPPSTNATSIKPPGSNPPDTNAANITIPPPIVPDSNVIKSNSSITRAECGRKQLCAAQPPNCDPSSGTCFFLGAQRLGGQNFRFALSGDSDGYIAATLSPSTTLGGNDTTYICANNNGVVKYFSALLKNGKLIRTTLNVNSVKGRVDGKNIQCEFDATVPDATNIKSRAATSSTTSFSMSVSTGSYNATSDDLGSPAPKITTGVVDLANVNATITNDINTTNTNTNTTTTAPSNTTTTAPSNTTTTAPSNTTTTVSSNTTATTTPAPLVPDSNVTNLNSSITRADCGKTQLCASQPPNCDPSSGTCFFLGAQKLGGQNFRFALSGDSDGYIAATLSPSTTLGGNDTTYICANNNGVVKYFSALLNNGKLIRTILKVNSVKGRVSGKKIQCQFDATVPDATKSRAATSTSFAMAVSTGSYNATSDDLGNPVFQIKTNVVDLTNVNDTITNLLNSNTTNTTTAASVGNAVTIQQSMMQALLITVGILNLTWL